MNTLFILLYFELTGLIISVLLVHLANIKENRKTVFFVKRLIYKKRKNQQWLIDYFQQHPEKIFKENFPELYKIAYATNEYKKINMLRKRGFLSDKEYERKLDKILYLVDVNLEFEGVICK